MKRFGPEIELSIDPKNYADCATMVEESDGDYVLYEKAFAELATLRAEIKQLKTDNRKLYGHVTSLDDKLRALSVKPLPNLPGVSK